MRNAGDIILIRFPQADLNEGKLRPALLLGELPGEYDDWLICMISSQTRHYLPGFDELVQAGDSDFPQSGLKLESVIRVGRLAVINGGLLLGEVGQISSDRTKQIKSKLADWILK
jgi:mRNA interferase MazF